MRRAAFALMTACLPLVSFSGLAWAETTSAQTFFVYAAGPPGASRTVVAAGPISGVGSVVIGSSEPGPGGTTIQHTTWVFPEGSLFVTLTLRFQNIFDPQLCIQTSNLTGTWQITGGTGRYSGATGSGTISGPNTGYFTRTPEGCSSTAYLRVTTFLYQGTARLGHAAAA